MLKPLRTLINELVAIAVLDLFPGALLGKSKITETQFFYSFHFPQGIHPDLIAIVSERIRSLLKENISIEPVEMTASCAAHYFDHLGQPFKANMVLEVEDNVLPMVRIGEFYDLLYSNIYKGPFESIYFHLFEGKEKEIDGLIWVEMSGTAYQSKEELKAFIKKRKRWLREEPWKEAERLGLMLYEKDASFLLPKGIKIYNKLAHHWRLAVSNQGLTEIISGEIDPSFIAERLKTGVAEWGLDSDICAFSVNFKELIKACISSLQFIDQTFNMLELSAKWVLFARNPGGVQTKQWKHRIDALTKALNECGFPYSIDQDSLKTDPTVELRILDSIGEYWSGPALKLKEGKASNLNGSIVYSLFGPIKRLIALLAEQKINKWL